MEDQESTANNATSEVAACCANFYEQSWVQELLGDAFHPGGVALSTRLVHSLNLPGDSRVLDVACGIGTTTLIMERQFGLESVGLDFSQSNVDKAIASAGKNPAVLCEFFQGSADELPFPDESFDALVCECAVSTFADQPRALAEFHRVVKPGGVVGITDMVVTAPLPDDIAQHIAPWTCMAEAHDIVGYQRLFHDAGFCVAHYVDESQGLLDMVSDLKKKLLMAGMGRALGAIPQLPTSISELRTLLRRARELTNEGVVQYCRMLFSKGQPVYPVPATKPLPPARPECDSDDPACC